MPAPAPAAKRCTTVKLPSCHRQNVQVYRMPYKGFHRDVQILLFLWLISIERIKALPRECRGWSN